jgi:hypothetical protein
MLVVPAAANDYIVCIEYDATGVIWASLTDYLCLGWQVDDTGANPDQPTPLLINPLPAPAPDTSPVLSPQWARAQGHHIVAPVPGAYRGTAYNFLDFIAFNGGAKRRLAGGSFLSATCAAAWSQWAAKNPGSVWSGPLTKAAQRPA